MKSNLFKILNYALFCLLLACNHSGHQHGDHQHQHGHSEEHSHHSHEHGHANHHMNQTSFEDLVKRFDSPERDAYQQPEKVLDYIGEVNGLSILDIGAGTGYFSFKLANRGAKVIAGDVDDRFQKFIQEQIDKDNAPKVELRKLPYDSPALQSKEVDKVLIVNTYHHIGNRVDYFKQVLSGLKDGGELLVIDFKKQDGPGPPVKMKMSEDFIVAELRKAGFQDFEINNSLLEHQYIIRAK